jgi:hypothetical protein
MNADRNSVVAQSAGATRTTGGAGTAPLELSAVIATSLGLAKADRAAA